MRGGGKGILLEFSYYSHCIPNYQELNPSNKKFILISTSVRDVNILHFCVLS
jgi:hypothetical protein